MVAEGYRDARTEVELGAGESAEFVIRAAFEPGRVVIDPDVLVLVAARPSTPGSHRFTQPTRRRDLQP
ncbi:MAG: hypothetical protein F4Z50_13395, partial [Gemmatimonadetes bacterium]|nr:hypothetical protein [Gemmatimonadota bacterium]